MINFDALRNAKVRKDPFTFMMGDGVVSADQGKAIRADYPEITRSGYHPLSRLNVKGAFGELIEDLQSTELADILSDKLELELRDKPRMITVRKLSKKTDGSVHNDSLSKICTFLIYLNGDWDASNGGAIRALNNDHDMDDFSAEVMPVAGNVFGFARSDTSWHGHPPFEGERYVVQTTFLIDQAALDRKENRGKLQLMLKKLNPFGK